jgi:hypothetical protein
MPARCRRSPDAGSPDGHRPKRLRKRARRRQAGRQRLACRQRSRPTWISAARSTGPTSSSSPSRSAATSPARSPISRCRRNTVGPAPDHRRHAGDRRHHARPAHRAASVEDLRGHARGLPPRRSCCNTSTRWRSTPGRSRRSIPDIKQVGLCHSVQGTAEELARDLEIPVERRSAIAPPASTTWRST